jgi:plasmid stabilization system protein ParE
MIRAKLSPGAERDLDGVCDHIAADNLDVGRKVRQTILDTADFLALNSAAGRRILKAQPRHATIRWFVVPTNRNFLIFYQPFGDTIVVVRILHAARDWTRFAQVSRQTAG